MQDPSIIRHRLRRLGRYPAWWAHVLALCAAVPALSCELVIGDAPNRKPVSLGDGGKSETPVATGGVTGSGGAPASGGTVGRGGTLSGTSGGSVGSGGVTSNAGSPGKDAGAGGRDIADAGSDAASDAGAPPCTSSVLWYQDADGDGYGNSDSTMFTCPAPPGAWVLVGGDCDDAYATVHPGQNKYFGAPYQRADNTDSFDYDCSGTEEPNPDLVPDPQNCGLLSLLLCNGASGYETNNRAGPGINPWCGSTIVRACVPSAAVCMSVERTGQPPFSCR